MQKHEIIHIHSLLLKIKEHLIEYEDNINEDLFKEYDDLDISPEIIYKSKSEHFNAIMVLGRNIRDAIQETDVELVTKEN